MCLTICQFICLSACTLSSTGRLNGPGKQADNPEMVWQEVGRLTRMLAGGQAGKRGGWR